MAKFWSYVSKHLKETGREGFYTVVKEIYAFKSVRRTNKPQQLSMDVVANLIIPVGAEVFIGATARHNFQTFPLSKGADRPFTSRYGCQFVKVRATHAIVHSVVTKKSKKQLKVAYALYDSNFEYRAGTTVYPDGWTKTDYICGKGIHFFFTLGEAMEYGR